MKTSKRTFNYFFAIIASLLITTSCADKAEEIVQILNPNLPLEGTVWTETSYTEKNCTDSAADRSGTSSCTATDCDTIELAGGTFTITELTDGVSSTQTGTYVLPSAGNIDMDFDGTVISVTYTILLDVLTINFIEPESGCDNTRIYSGK